MLILLKDPNRARNRKDYKETEIPNINLSVDQILKRYEDHRKKHSVRIKMRTHGWEELNKIDPENK